MSPNQGTLEKLLILRKELTERIDAIDRDLHHKKIPVEKDFAEQVTQRENDEVLSAIDGESKLTVQHINDAISRIKSGSYGICAGCGVMIPNERLSALPYVTTCKNCAE